MNFTWAREVVAKRVAIVAAVPVLVSYIASGAALFGIDLPTGLSDQATGVVSLTLTFLGFIVGAYYARNGVTPADPKLAPKTTDGKPLIVPPGV